MEYDEIFEMFKSSYVGKEIKKDVILEKLTDSEDKEIVERFANSFYIKYSVKAEDINKKAEENFEEIQIIEIDINDFRAIYDIYGILLSIIPYPILALFNYNNRISFAVSNRILAEEKNNKGKIYTSYLIKKEDIAKYLKIDIDSCYSMIEIYNKWIENIEDVVAYYERLDSVMETIEIGFHIKSDEVLEKLETYIARDCGTYNMKPKDGWKSKLEKYEENISLQKKVETHILWEYLSENTFLKNRLEDFTSWNDFKKTCAYNNNSNDIYYSQYNSRYNSKILDNEEIYNDKYKRKRDIFSSYNTKTKYVKTKSEKIENEIFDETDYDLLKYENAREEIKNDKKFMLKAIKKDYRVLAYASETLKNDIDFMIQAIENNYLCIKFAGKKLLNDEEFILNAIIINPSALGYASNRLRNNKDFVLTAIRKGLEQDYSVLAFASNELMQDKRFMLKAIEINESNIVYASNELRHNKEFLLQAIEVNLLVLGWIDYEFKKDKEFMLKAIEINSLSLIYASNELKNDQDVVFKAVKRASVEECYALQLVVSDELKNNANLLKIIKSKSSK